MMLKMITESTTLFTTFAGIFGVGVLTLLVVSRAYLSNYQPMFTVAVLVPVIAGLSYLLAAYGIGYVTVDGSTVNVVRYIDWIITTPILMYLLAYAMIPNSQEMWQTFSRWGVLILAVNVCGLAAELVGGTFKALLFTLSSLIYLSVLYLVIDRLLVLDQYDLSDQQRYFALLMAWVILILWTGYPVVWILGPSGIAAFSAALTVGAFGVLDVLTKIGFAYLLLQYLSFQMAYRNQDSL